MSGQGEPVKTIEELKDEIVRTSLIKAAIEKGRGVGPNHFPRPEYRAWRAACEAYEQATKPPTADEIVSWLEAWNKGPVRIFDHVARQTEEWRARLAASKEAKP